MELDHQSDGESSVPDIPQTTVVKRKRAKAHFTKRNGPKIQCSYDLMECIAKYGLMKDPLCIVLLCMTNKGLYQQLMECHDMWRELYIKWTGWYDGSRPLPNMQLHSGKMEFQPALCTDLIPLEKQPAFNKGVKKIMALEHVNRCTVCADKKRFAHPFWYLNKKLCNMCIPDAFVSDQVCPIMYCLIYII